MQSTVESGERAGYNGHKRKQGAQVGRPPGRMAVDTLGALLALHVSPANVDDREAVAALVARVQEATGDHVTLA